MGLFALTIVGGVACASVAALQQRRKKLPLGVLIAGKDQQGPYTHDEPRFIDGKAVLETFHHTYIEPLIEEARATYHTWRHSSLGGLVQDTRSQQLAELTGEEIELSAREQEQNHYLAVSITALGITSVTMLLHSPLILASVPLLAYSYVNVLKAARQAFQEKRLRLLRTFEIIIIGGELLAGLFFASALASTLYYLGERALVKAETRSRQSLINVFGQQTHSAWVLIDGNEIEVDYNQLQAGDIVVVNAGEVIPVDGTIIDGLASIDQHMLTGESQPAEKGIGDQVLAPTVVLSGKIHIQVERAGSETTAAQIGEILNQTAEYKQSIELQGIALVERFIPPTLLLGAVSLPFVGVNRALALLESSFGYNLRLSGPMSLLNLLQIAARQGILIKDGHALEQLHRIDTVIFDKTGTLTLEQPHVGAVHTYSTMNEHDVLTCAAAAEYRQTHPVARAILQAARERALTPPGIDAAEYKVGYGIKATLNGQVIRVGSDRFLATEAIALPEKAHQLQTACHDQGYSLVLVAVDHTLVGAIELHPTIRPEAHQIVQQLQARGLMLSIISGDHEQPTRRLAHSLGIDHYVASVLPQDKAAQVEQLQREGHTVCFVGDGINDAIALQQADLSISLRGASTAATDTAQIVLMDGSLCHLVALLDLGREYQTNMRGNLLMSTVPSVICIGGVYLLKWGVVTAIMLYNASIVGSMGNAMLPVLVRQFKGNGDERTPPAPKYLKQPEK